MVHYALEPNLGAFTTRTTAILRQDGKADPSFQSAAIYQVPLPTGSREDVLARLSADEGKMLRALMRESVSETLKMVSLDWSAPSDVTPSPARGPTAHRFNFDGSVVDLPAVIVAAADGRTVVRNESGVLFSLRKESE